MPIRSEPVYFDITCPPNTVVTWEIFTLAFRKIYSGSQTFSENGTVSWDLKDKADIQVANGVYYILVKAFSLGVPITKILKVLVWR
jgi:hypothetical protein